MEPKRIVRRGRLPAAERAERRAAVLSAAEEELLEHGYSAATMLGIARRAGASKETLYSWFGNRDGLFSALIEANADGAAASVKAALDDIAPMRDVLTSFAIGLLTLLTGPSSVAINRGAMQEPALASRLLASGRYRVGPIVEDYLSRLATDGAIDAPDPAAAFTALYGLVIRDTQISVLLGQTPPSPQQIRAQAASGVDAFLQLHAR